MGTVYEKIINFRYKGTRSYVQGPDIYNAVIQFARRTIGGYPDDLSASFHSMLRNKGLIRIQEDNIIQKEQSFCAYFTMRYKVASFYVSVLDTEEAIEVSYEYNEEAVLSSSSFIENMVKMRYNTSYSYIEQFVAMNKLLHQYEYPETRKIGKWLFTKIQLKEAINSINYMEKSEISVRIDQNFYNKLTRSTLFLDSKPIGSIWFSLLGKEG